jgi:hypothetical protein
MGGNRLKARIDRERKMVVLTIDDPRAREGLNEEMPFDSWFEFSERITQKIARSHRA